MLAILMAALIESSRVLFHPPFSSHGLDLKKWPFGPHIMSITSWIDAKAYDVSGLVDESMLAIFFYGSLTVAYNSYGSISRVYPSLPPLPSEAQLLLPLCFFMMGKQMSRFDVIPALEHVDQKLEESQTIVKQSHAVMEDLLPGFVVDAIMSNSQPIHTIDNEADFTSEPLINCLDSFIETVQAIDAPRSPLANGSTSKANNLLSKAPSWIPPDRANSNLQRDASVSSQIQPTSSHLHLNRGVSMTPSLLRSHGSLPRAINPQSQKHDCISVFFSDLVGFSTWSHTCDPDLVMATLDDLCSRLDTILMEEMPGLYKVETVGDAYVVAANLVAKDRC